MTIFDFKVKTSKQVKFTHKLIVLLNLQNICIWLYKQLQLRDQFYLYALCKIHHILFIGSLIFLNTTLPKF